METLHVDMYQKPVVNGVMIGNVTLSLSSEEEPAWIIRVGAMVQAFSAGYSTVHPYLCLLLAIVGLLVNSLAAVILIRAKRLQATNLLLLSFSLSNLLPLPLTLVYTFRFHLLSEGGPESRGQDYEWVVFLIGYHLIYLTMATWSLLLLFTLVTFQYILVRVAGAAKGLCSQKKALLGVGVVLGIGVVPCVPAYMSYVVVPVANTSLFWVAYSRSAFLNGGVIMYMHLWFDGFLLSFCGTVALTIMCGLLLRASNLMMVKRRSVLKGTKLLTSLKRCIRTRYTLVAVILLVNISSLPRSVALMLAQFYGNVYYERVYKPLGEFFDGLRLLETTFGLLAYFKSNHQLRVGTRRVLRSFWLKLRPCLRSQTTLAGLFVAQSSVSTVSPALEDLAGLLTRTAMVTAGLDTGSPNATSRPSTSHVSCRENLENVQTRIPIQPQTPSPLAWRRMSNCDTKTQNMILENRKSDGKGWCMQKEIAQRDVGKWRLCCLETDQAGVAKLLGDEHNIPVVIVESVV